MKKTLLAVVTCLAIIIAGVFFTVNHAEARVFARSGSTGCSAPASGDAIGPCGNVEKKKVSVTAPKHWHHHWHFHHHFHFRHHHFHVRFHHHGGRSHGRHGHSGRHHHHH